MQMSSSSPETRKQKRRAKTTKTERSRIAADGTCSARARQRVVVEDDERTKRGNIEESMATSPPLDPFGDEMPPHNNYKDRSIINSHISRSYLVQIIVQRR